MAPNVPLDVRGNSSISGTEQIDSGVVMNGQSLPAVSSAGTGKMIFTNNQFQVSENGAAFKALGGGSSYEFLAIDVNTGMGTAGWVPSRLGYPMGNKI